MGTTADVPSSATARNGIAGQANVIWRRIGTHAIFNFVTGQS
jgi:hypothetical protein